MDPVCPLRLALYGHPESGGYWEQYATRQVCKAGFSPIKSWGSCFFHPTLRLFLIIYVDDFKLAGPQENLAEGWRLIRKNIVIEDPGPVAHFLGCTHRVGVCRLSSGSLARTMVYDMENFLQQCLEAYQKIIGPRWPMKQVPTPFLDEGTAESSEFDRSVSLAAMPVVCRTFPDYVI